MNNLDLTIAELQAIAETLEAKSHDYFEEDSDYEVLVSAAKKIDIEINRLEFAARDVRDLTNRSY